MASSDKKNKALEAINQLEKQLAVIISSLKDIKSSLETKDEDSDKSSEDEKDYNPRRVKPDSLSIGNIKQIMKEVKIGNQIDTKRLHQLSDSDLELYKKYHVDNKIESITLPTNQSASRNLAPSGYKFDANFESYPSSAEYDLVEEKKSYYPSKTNIGDIKKILEKVNANKKGNSANSAELHRLSDSDLKLYKKYHVDNKIPHITLPKGQGSRDKPPKGYDPESAEGFASKPGMQMFDLIKVSKPKTSDSDSSDTDEPATRKKKTKT